MRMVVVLKSGKEFVSGEIISRKDAIQNLKILNDNWSNISSVVQDYYLFPSDLIEYIYFKND